MSDFLSDFIAPDGVVTKEVSFNGKSGPVHFRRITAGQKANLLKGQKGQSSGGKTTFEIDLAENAHSKALLVFYSVANQDGNQFFKKLDDVKAIDAGKFEALYLAASDVNKDDMEAADPGKD